MNIALLTAAGASTRMGQDIPKQFLTVNERPVIVYTMEVFQHHPEIDEIVVVCLDGWDKILRAYADQFKITKLKLIVRGGETGQESIYNGITALAENHDKNDLILVHDGNRPFLPPKMISDCIDTAHKYGCSVAAIPCQEAMVLTDDGVVSKANIDREHLKRTQTPHGFTLGKMLELHERARENGINNTTATCTLMMELGEPVYFYPGSEKNIKLTTLDDMDIFKALLMAKRADWLKE
jgi:2-C-methyl-D-erythritol 4-phosphate cytidylyltransferase